MTEREIQQALCRSGFTLLAMPEIDRYAIVKLLGVLEGQHVEVTSVILNNKGIEAQAHLLPLRKVPKRLYAFTMDEVAAWVETGPIVECKNDFYPLEEETAD